MVCGKGCLPCCPFLAAHALPADFGQQFFNAALSGDVERGSNVGQRNQDEGAFGDAGMGDGEARVMDDFLSVEEDVEVQGARAVFFRADASVCGFDGVQCGKQAAGRQGGVVGAYGVQEIGLFGDAEGRGAVERRGGDFAEVGMQREGLACAQQLFARFVLVAAEGDVDAVCGGVHGRCRVC